MSSEKESIGRMGTAMELLSIYFRYKDTKDYVLKGVSIMVRKGCVTGIVGPNGSGKSTIIGCACGILTPEKGNVLINGQSICDFRRKDLARIVATVHQRPPVPPFTVFDFMLLAEYPVKTRENTLKPTENSKLREIINDFSLERLLDRDMGKLSGGELKRVYLAAALMREPSILLLDEPTSDLDIGYKKKIAAMLDYITENKGISVLISTHDLNLAAIYTDYVYMMRNGRIIDAGLPERILTEDNIYKTFGVKTEVIHTADGKIKGILPYTSEY